MNSYRLNAETEPNLGPVAQLNRILPWVIGLAVLGLVLSRYLPQIHKNEDLRRDLQRKTDEVRRLTTEVNRLKAENAALFREPRTIERTAREQLSFARPDERVVTFQDVPAVGGGAGSGSPKPTSVPAPNPRPPAPGTARGPN